MRVFKYYDCHNVTEIRKGLFISGRRDVAEMVQAGVDVLLPLDSLRGDVWETGFRGEILYYPIMDCGVLPDDVLDRLIDDIFRRLDAGKRVGMFCIGGHGRTGYVAACVLARDGVENPIAYLHEHYCRFAVESDEQREAIRRFQNKLPERMDGKNLPPVPLPFLGRGNGH